MSGTGGSSGYIPPQAAKFNCQTGQIRTTVSSINLDVLKKHEIGAILNIKIGRKDILIIEDGDGEILGSILHPNTEDIVECIKEGNFYQASILSKTTVSCIVSIKRK